MKKSILTSNGYNRDDIAYNGNRFLVGNGYFGIRGTLEEYTRSELCAVNLAGVYDRAGGGWRESVNAPDPMYTYVTVNGKKYALPETEPVSHSQSLDIKNGILSRETVWDTGAGKIRIRSERFACMAEGFKRFACMKYVFSADTECEAELATGINGDVWDINGPHFAELYTAADGETETVTGVTGEKHIKVTVREKVTQDFSAEITANTDGRAAMRLLRFTARPGEEYAVEKTAVTVTSLDGGGIDGFEASYEELRAAHTAAWNRIWDVSEIEIDGDDEAEFALNYSVYHLNCIAPRELYRSEAVSIPARGLSGQVYKGAVFWDTEMFMLDYYAHTEPEIAKTLLRYRVETLDGARKKAAEYGYDGAYYAWESQEGGREGCSDYNVTDVFTKRPMRTHFRDKQYHVSAAVVYGFVKYIRATSDMSVLSGGGMETIIECARFYRSLLLTRADRRVYELRDVVGPDEYHERVDNNAYTNRMAKLVFDTALELTEAFCKLYPDEAAELDRRYGISELKAMFKDSSENILIKAPDENWLIEQFDGYFGLEDASVSEVRGRLIDPREYWGGAYGVASGTQVIKQADVAAMLAIFDGDYDTETKRRNFEYYEPRTEHGSSLSACMYSLLACRIGRLDTAYELFMKSATADLTKGGKEWAGLVYIGGTHPASAGGAWIAAVNGFAGVSVKNGALVCEPSLPKKWTGMRFKLRFGGRLYRVKISGGKGVVYAEDQDRKG